MGMVRAFVFTVSDDKVNVTFPATQQVWHQARQLPAQPAIRLPRLIGSWQCDHIATGHGLYGSTPVNTNQDTATANATQTPGLSCQIHTSGAPMLKWMTSLLTVTCSGRGNVT